MLPALIDSRGLQDHMGIPRRAAEAIMRQVPTVRIPGYNRNFVRLSDIDGLLTVVRPADKMPMVGSAHIRSRTTAKGEKRYDVRYRLASESLKHGGTFKMRRDAETRKGFILGELAAGRDPRASLNTLRVVKPRATLADAFTEYRSARQGVSEGTKRGYDAAKDAMADLMALAPDEIATADIQGWIASTHLSRGTINRYRYTLAKVLDYCEVEPNPARSKKIELPAADREEVNPPTWSEFAAILEKLSTPFVLPFRLMECLGLRVGETVALTWGDVDVANSRFRISKGRTKGGTKGQRWLPVPPELMDELDALLPLEDRSRERRLFDKTEGGCYQAMRGACQSAKIAHYSPHDLRHRRCSLWLLHGIDPLSASVWAGHSDPSMTTDKYGHVLVSGDDEWRGFWLGVYQEERLPDSGAVGVRARRGGELVRGDDPPFAPEEEEEVEV